MGRKVQREKEPAKNNTVVENSVIGIVKYTGMYPGEQITLYARSPEGWKAFLEQYEKDDIEDQLKKHLEITFFMSLALGRERDQGITGKQDVKFYTSRDITRDDALCLLRPMLELGRIGLKNQLRAEFISRYLPALTEDYAKEEGNKNYLDALRSRDITKSIIGDEWLQVDTRATLMALTSLVAKGTGEALKYIYSYNIEGAYPEEKFRLPLGIASYLLLNYQDRQVEVQRNRAQIASIFVDIITSSIGDFTNLVIDQTIKSVLTKSTSIAIPLLKSQLIGIGAESIGQKQIKESKSNMEKTLSGSGSSEAEKKAGISAGDGTLRGFAWELMRYATEFLNNQLDEFIKECHNSKEMDASERKRRIFAAQTNTTHMVTLLKETLKV